MFKVKTVAKFTKNHAVSILAITLIGLVAGIIPLSAQTLNGGNDFDPSWPDGLAGSFEFYTPGASAIKIPSSGTFYITALSTTQAQYLDYGSTLSDCYGRNLADEVLYVDSSATTEALSTPIPMAGGDYLCASSGSTPIQVTGMLVPTGVTPEALGITSGLGWTIPTGKTLYISDVINNENPTGVSLNFYSGSSTCSGTPNGRILWTLGENATDDLNSPIPVSNGTLCTNTSGFISVLGYSINNSKL